MDKDITKQIRILLIVMDMTQGELADRIKMSHPTMVKKLKNPDLFKIGEIKRIEEVLKGEIL